MSTFLSLSVAQPEQEPDNFVTANDFAKLDDLIDSIALQARKRHLGYDQLCYVFKEVRKRTGLKKPKKGRRLLQLLTKADLEAFFTAIDNVEHELMMRFLLYSAIRVNELVNIKMNHVDLSNCKVYIEQGKGQKCGAPHFCPYVLVRFMLRWQQNGNRKERRRRLAAT